MALFNSEACEFMDGEWVVVDMAEVDNEALELYERYLCDEDVDFKGINEEYKNKGKGNK